MTSGLMRALSSGAASGLGCEGAVARATGGFKCTSGCCPKAKTAQSINALASNASISPRARETEPRYAMETAEKSNQSCSAWADSNTSRFASRPLKSQAKAKKNAAGGANDRGGCNADVLRETHPSGAEAGSPYFFETIPRADALG